MCCLISYLYLEKNWYLYAHMPTLTKFYGIMSLSYISWCIILFQQSATPSFLKEVSCTKQLFGFLDLYWHVVSLICRMMSKNKATQNSDVPYISSILACRILRAMQPKRSLLRWTDDLHKIFVEAVAHQGGPYGLVPWTLSLQCQTTHCLFCWSEISW
jgi:hypothetical protein